VDQILPESKILDAWSRSQKFAFRLHSPGLNRSQILKVENFSDTDRIRIQKFGTGAELQSEKVTPATSDYHPVCRLDIRKALVCLQPDTDMQKLISDRNRIGIWTSEMLFSIF